MNKRLLATLLVSLPLGAALSPARATTVAPPPNLGQLARASETVVLASALESWVDEGGGSLPTTITRFQLARTVAGADTGFVFEVRSPGGTGKEQGAVVEGAPRFAADHDYLLFLDRAPLARWQAKMMSYGLLVQDPDGDLLRPLAEASQIEMATARSYEPVGAYHRDALLAHLGAVARGAAWSSALAGAVEIPGRTAPPVGRINAAFTAPQFCVYLLDPTDGNPNRWFGYETGASSSIQATTPGQTGVADGGVGAVQAGTSAWTGHSDSVIRYNYGGTRARNITCTGNFDIDSGGVVFDDPCNDIADLSSCNGTLAIGGSFYGNQTQTYDGQPWHPATATFAVVNNGAQCVGTSGFQEAISHELGHSQGFGHHNPPNPATALMSAFLKNDGMGAALRAQDKICAAFSYHTYLDVPYNYWTWRWIEGLENAGVPTGCTTGNYCPAADMTRSDMAIFLLRSKEGGSYTPPACTVPMFLDVPCSNPAAPWINELVRRGVTAGCGGGNYCPGTAVTRSQMAVFLLVTLEGPGYSPAACTTPAFADMPCSSPFAKWVNELVRRGITAGCGGGNYCPNSTVHRDQMSVFLTTTFSLPLPPAP